MFSTILKFDVTDPTMGTKRTIFFVGFGMLFVVSLLFSLIGPFGTFQVGDFIDRLMYWFVVNGVSISIALSIKHFVVRDLDHWPPIGKESVIILGITLLFTPLLWYWTMFIFPGLIVAPPSMLWIGGIVLTTCASMSVLLHGALFFMRYADQSTDVVAATARIVRRLPETFDGKIIHLNVDGHIVRVMTNVGSFELRMRFADAVDEVSELDGICTHRSHWVAVSEIVNVGWVSGRPSLHLSNGQEIPISRKYQPNLEAIGIL